jgi:hypothetical protein
VKANRNCFFFAALLAAGTLTFLLAVAKREKAPMSLPSSPPEGGEREGEFELFIGS